MNVILLINNVIDLIILIYFLIDFGGSGNLGTAFVLFICLVPIVCIPWVRAISFAIKLILILIAICHIIENRTASNDSHSPASIASGEDLSYSANTNDIETGKNPNYRLLSSDSDKHNTKGCNQDGSSFYSDYRNAGVDAPTIHRPFNYLEYGERRTRLLQQIEREKLQEPEYKITLWWGLYGLQVNGDKTEMISSLDESCENDKDSGSNMSSAVMHVNHVNKVTSETCSFFDLTHEGARAHMSDSKEVSSPKNPLPPVDFFDYSKVQVGSFLTHKIFGRGIVTVLDEKYICVKFGNKEKRFLFPDVITLGFMSMPISTSPLNTALSAEQIEHNKRVLGEL